MHNRILSLPDAAATEAAGRALGGVLQPGMVVTLSGDLGAGKTTFVRGVLRAFDIKGPVKSPTYTLVEPYAVSSLYLYHFDFYRLTDPEEWEAAGFREYFRNDAICLVEWPE
ncbi:MAG: tRNA (adenosine(37)-N6)-threonylcarbamoyltransferase complex ATPase subunit type 1 TsaE, partial [Betaproteobacteria bacterium]